MENTTQNRERMQDALATIPGVEAVGEIGMGLMGDSAELRMGEWPVEELDPVEQIDLNCSIWIHKITTRTFQWEAVVTVEIHRYPEEWV